MPQRRVEGLGERAVHLDAEGADEPRREPEGRAAQGGRGEQQVPQGEREGGERPERDEGG